MSISHNQNTAYLWPVPSPEQDEQRALLQDLSGGFTLLGC